MITVEKIRKISVISFILIGLFLGAYEKNIPRYEGIGNGFGGDVVVSILMTKDKIKEIKIIEHSETEGISDQAFLEIPNKIIKAESALAIESIEAIAGATYTSEGIKEAVLDAINKSK